MTDRIRMFGQPTGSWGENIMYGSDTGKDVVISLLIDDGVSNRGHRTNLFNSQWNLAGSYTGPHKTYRTETCIDYAVGMVGSNTPSQPVQPSRPSQPT